MRRLVQQGNGCSQQQSMNNMLVQCIERCVAQLALKTMIACMLEGMPSCLMDLCWHMDRNRMCLEANSLQHHDDASFFAIDWLGSSTPWGFASVANEATQSM